MNLIVKELTSGNGIASGEEGRNVRVFEGNWYFQPNVVNMEHLKITERIYTCPYKGVCYWIDLETPDGRVARNVAWVYRQPKPGYEFITDQIGFYARATAGTVVEKVPASQVA
jgi:uncharacterized protein (DUF427 family)